MRTIRIKFGLSIILCTIGAISLSIPTVLIGAIGLIRSIRRYKEERAYQKEMVAFMAYDRRMRESIEKMNFLWNLESERDL